MKNLEEQILEILCMTSESMVEVPFRIKKLLAKEIKSLVEANYYPEEFTEWLKNECYIDFDYDIGQYFWVVVKPNQNHLNTAEAFEYWKNLPENNIQGK